MNKKTVLGLILGIAAVVLFIALAYFALNALNAGDSSFNVAGYDLFGSQSRAPWTTDNQTASDEHNVSAHGNTFHGGENNNTYCAHCMSPWEYDPAANYSVNDGIDEANWTGINCTVCHDPYTNELALYNGTGREAPVSNPADLCVVCHSGTHHPEGDNWAASAHGDTDHGYNLNTYCAHCMSPFQYDPAATNSSNSSPVDSANWTSITCTVCHTPHGQELKLYDGTDYQNVTGVSDLCVSCHNGDHHPEGDGWMASAHGNTNHGYNLNTYCAHCMSPFQYDPAATNSSMSTPVDAGNWTDIGCNVCHEPHSLEVMLYNGTEYVEVMDVSRDLCGACHTGSHHTQTADWNSSAHSDTYHGYNDNTYCSHCMSPFQYDGAENSTAGQPVGEDNWTSIGCTVCHNPHSLELQLFNGTEREEPVTRPSDLCIGCHQGDHHPEGDEWLESAHGNTNHGYNSNSYCAHCMSPYQYDGAVNSSVANPVSAENWTDIGCNVCHEQHSLELGLYNGTEFNLITDISRELCGECHQGSKHPQLDKWNMSAHANTYHGYNDNSYCAHCMSPFQYDGAEDSESGAVVGEDNWTAIGCTVCHNQHSLELELYNGTGREKVEDISRDLCGACHQGDHHPQTSDWEAGAHSDTYHGYNDNTYCAHCMSPFQYDGAEDSDSGVAVGEDNWTSIGCVVCHDPHSLELALFNGTEREEPVTRPSDLCVGCHQGDHHPEGDEWMESAHGNTYHGYNANEYCAHCMSPFEADLSKNRTTADDVAEEDWGSIGCTVCHTSHGLELKLYNGSDYQDVDDISRDLCGECHQGSKHPALDEWSTSAHANTYHGYNDNTYCAHCMSPFQYDGAVNRSAGVAVGEDNWTSIGCIVCHNQHSLELQLFNGTEREEVATNPADLCTGCHQGDHHPQGDNWKASKHASTGALDKNNSNTFCARCHSPFESDPTATFDNNENVAEGSGVTCTVCHNPHSLELEFYNGSAYEEVESTEELCGECHSGVGEFEGAPEVSDVYGQWQTSGHFNTFKGFNGNTYCSHCMSPFNYDEAAVNSSVAEPVSAENWTGITCVVCHEPHSTGLKYFNGTDYVAAADATELCGFCHTMGDAELGDEPHHPQLEMRAGSGGYGVADNPWMGNADCNMCHLVDGNHSFEANAEGCMNCHDIYKNITVAQAKLDNVQAETQVLLDQVHTNLSMAEAAKEAAVEAGTWNSSLDDTLNRAIFNYYMVENDKSVGMHNPDYAESLLELANEDANAVLEQFAYIPSIVVTPKNEAVDVPVDTVVTVTFETQINFTAFLADELLTVDGVTGTLTYDNTTMTVTFTPDAALAFETEYTATLGMDVEALDGSEILVADYSWTFTTIADEPDTYTVTVTLLDENGDPVTGVTVTITLGNDTWSQTTDDNGVATFTEMPWATIPDDANLSADGKTWKGSDPVPEWEAKKTKSEFPWIIVVILVIVVLIVIGAVVFFMMKKKKEEEEAAGEEDEDEEDEEEEESEVECPECGAMAGAGETECPECGEELPEPEEEEEDEDEEEEEAEDIVCPECAAVVPAGEGECPECGEELPEPEEGEEGEDEEGEDEEGEEEGEEDEEGEEAEEEAEEEDLDEEEAGEEDLAEEEAEEEDLEDEDEEEEDDLDLDDEDLEEDDDEL